MKSLLDIQEDLRKLEAKLSEASKDLQTIHEDVEEMRTANQTEDALDYAKIERMAGLYTFGEHPISKLEDAPAKIYLEMLLNITRLEVDAEANLMRFVFIQWLQLQSGIQWSLRELYADCHNTDIDTFYDMVETIPDNYKESLIVDAVLTANINGAANGDILEYISSIGAVLGIENNRFCTLLLIAKVILKQSLVGTNNKNFDKVYGELTANYMHYLMDTAILYKGLVNRRTLTLSIPENNVRNFKWKVDNYQFVRKGEEIVEYVDNNDLFKDILGMGTIYNYKQKTSTVTATASDSGTIFQFKLDHTYYGIISSPNDDKESIKKWVKDGCKRY